MRIYHLELQAEPKVRKNNRIKINEKIMVVTILMKMVVTILMKMMVTKMTTMTMILIIIIIKRN